MHRLILRDGVFESMRHGALTASLTMQCGQARFDRCLTSSFSSRGFLPAIRSARR